MRLVSRRVLSLGGPAAACRARSRRVSRLLPGLRSAPVSLAVLGNAARRRRRPAVRPRGPWRSSRQRAAGPPRRVAASGLTLLLVADRDCPRPRPQRVCRPTRAGARETIKTVDERAVTDRHRASGGTDVACRVADPCRVPRRSAIPPAARLARTRAWSAPRARRGRVPQPAVDPVAARTR